MLLAAFICPGLDCISKSLSPGATGRKQSAIQPPLCSYSSSSMDRPSDTHPPACRAGTGLVQVPVSRGSPRVRRQVVTSKRGIEARVCS